MRIKKRSFRFGLLILFSISGCLLPTQINNDRPGERRVVEITLNGSITKKKAELSGMTWIGDTLILMPQYPEKFGPNEGALFTITKQAILDYLDGRSKEPITPSKITLIAPGLKNGIQDYEGFESIGYWNQHIYLTIESGKKDHMMGYLVSGMVSSDLKEITLDTTHLVEIEPAIQMDNRTDEALVILQDKVFTFFEINSSGLNPQPAAHVFSLDLKPEGSIPFPNLEYRITDAAPGSNGDIWVINNVTPKDTLLFTEFDPLLEKDSSKAASKDIQQMERLVKLKLTSSGFEFASEPPIQIALDKAPRNWEGLVLLDKRGFLLATDMEPDTVLGFISLIN